MAARHTLRGTILEFLSVVEFAGQDVLCCARCVAVAALDGHVDRLFAALKLHVADAVLVELVRDVELLVEVVDHDRAVLALFNLGLVEVLKEFFLRQCPLRAIRLEGDASAAPLALVSFAVGIVTVFYRHLTVEPELHRALNAAEIRGIGNAAERQHKGGGEAKGRRAAQRALSMFLFRHLHYLRQGVRGGVQRCERALEFLFFCHCLTPPPKSF